MSQMKELQNEEREALCSIYEGDISFKEINETTFQYKYGEDNNPQSFLVELAWNESYPDVPPIINMDTFYNRHLIPTVKDNIKSVLNTEAQQWLGCGMTYTLFECLKDRIDEIVKDQPETSAISSTSECVSGIENLQLLDANSGVNKKFEKREQLTKAQKRRQWERTDHKGERARGWNWVDIVKHLSQTGNKGDSLVSSNDVINSTS